MNETEIRDRLAAIRSELANERTFLAWVRTAIAVVAGGAAMKVLVETAWLRAAGVGLMAAGLSALIFGVVRFRQTRRKIDEAKRLDRP
ncbi:MAG TPA: DUF202 domain-containing protein [Thermoanaerobaculia bacterium]|nr:DUF202 domain-containing protein [Thermoanaerobaculia bacterium]